MAQDPMGLRLSIPVPRECSRQEESQMPVGTEIRMDLDRILQLDGCREVQMETGVE